MDTPVDKSKGERAPSPTEELASSLPAYDLKELTQVTSRIKEALGTPAVMPFLSQGENHAELLYKKNSEKREAEWYRASTPLDLKKVVPGSRHA